jgi:thioredoxin-related protein
MFSLQVHQPGKMPMKTLLMTVCFTFCLSSGLFALDNGKALPSLDTSDIQGKAIKTGDLKDKIVVFEWTNRDCPFVKKHYSSGNMQKLQTFATGKDIVWITVCSQGEGKNGHVNAEEAGKWLSAQKASPSHFLLDAAGTLAQAFGAKVTPHIFIFDKKGILAYQGAVDDNKDANPQSIPAAKNMVQAALDELLAGKPVSKATCTPYGCGVKYGK